MKISIIKFGKKMWKSLSMFQYKTISFMLFAMKLKILILVKIFKVYGYLLMGCPTPLNNNNPKKVIQKEKLHRQKGQSSPRKKTQLHSPKKWFGSSFVIQIICRIINMPTLYISKFGSGALFGLLLDLGLLKKFLISSPCRGL